MTTEVASGIDVKKEQLWALTTFFNPLGCQIRIENYKIFREKLRQQNVMLLTVELVYSNNRCELTQEDSDIHIRVVGNERNILWQKEQLLNIGLQNLPKECAKFAWLDCDIIFENENWAKDTLEALDRHLVIQPFSKCMRLPKGATSAQQASIRRATEVRPSLALRVALGHSQIDEIQNGHSGFAWAACRRIFDDLGFYNKMVFGGGDTVLASGFLNHPNHKLCDILSPKLRDDQLTWIKEMGSRTSGNVGYVEGPIFHLWHGKPQNRLSLKRHEMLKKHDYDPACDVEIDPANQCLRWANNDKLAMSALSYFRARNDDNNILVDLRNMVVAFPSKLIKGLSFLKYFDLSTLISLPTFLIEYLRYRINKKKFSDQKLSVVFLNWKTPELVKELLEQYLSYNFVDDIVVWNNNSDAKFEFRHPSVKIVNTKFDSGLDSRYAAATLTNNEHVLIHDNDLMLPSLSLRMLFVRYLGSPDIIHACAQGRNVSRGYNQKNVYGDVDIVLTRCQIMNKKYIPEFFKAVNQFDYIRKYCCGNGEDIIMNYVVRSVSKKRNRAYNFPRAELIDESGKKFAIYKRPFHNEVRNEITKKCKHVFVRQSEVFMQNQNLVKKISASKPEHSWSNRRVHDKEIFENLIESHTFVSEQKVRDSVSLLARLI